MTATMELKGDIKVEHSYCPQCKYFEEELNGYHVCDNRRSDHYGHVLSDKHPACLNFEKET